MKLKENARFSTVCLHAGQEPDPSTGAIITPIYQTATYVQDELGRHKGYEYGRTQNPTRATLERNIAAIEGGKMGFAFASGMAAIGAIGTMLKAGDHVVVSDNTYGGTFRFFDKVLTRLTLWGALYVAAVCLLPEFLVSSKGVPFQFGGTSLLIVVVVVMDFIAQFQAHMMSHHYPGLLKKANLLGTNRGTERNPS